MRPIGANVINLMTLPIGAHFLAILKTGYQQVMNIETKLIAEDFAENSSIYSSTAKIIVDQIG